MDVSKFKLGFAIDSTWILPCVGFGSYLFIADSLNSPVALASNGEIAYFGQLVSVLLLIGAVWWALRQSWDNKWSVPAVAVSALLVSAYYVVALFFPDVMQQPVIGVLVETAAGLGRAVLAFFWMVAVLPLGSRRVVYVLTIAICVFASFCLITFLFKDSVARMSLVLLPVLSAICLQLFYRMRSRSFDLESPVKDEIYVQSQKYLGKRANRLVFIGGIVTPLVCGSLVLVVVHDMWPYKALELTQLLSAQTGLLIGAAVMAILQLVLVNFFWTSTNFLFASVVVPLFLMDMLLISIAEPTWVTIYFALMLLAEKSLLALAVYSSYMFKLGDNWLTPWCIAFLSFQLGGLLGTSILRYFAIGNPMFLLTIIVTVYIASVCLASLYFGVRVAQTYEGSSAGGFRREGRYLVAVDELVRSFNLTSREGEILAELGRGRNAAYIAERLTLSPQTVKTHQKNIYAKMDLHSQQDLIMLIDKTIDESRSA